MVATGAGGTNTITHSILVSANCPSVSVMQHSASTFTLLQNIPNPFAGKTTIQFNTESIEKVKFVVMNLLGETVASNVISVSKGTNNYEFSTNLPAGIYTYSLTQGSKTLTKRMIITE